jgi:hypothetical protein
MMTVMVMSMGMVMVMVMVMVVMVAGAECYHRRHDDCQNDHQKRKKFVAEQHGGARALAVCSPRVAFVC